jgi:hypothetical protein
MQHERLEHFTERLKRHPGLIAHNLRLLTRQEIAARLNIDQAAVTRLLLCRTPRTDHTTEDMQEIAGYIGANASDLAILLRDGRLVEYTMQFMRAGLDRPKDL